MQNTNILFFSYFVFQYNIFDHHIQAIEPYRRSHEYAIFIINTRSNKHSCDKISINFDYFWSFKKKNGK